MTTTPSPAATETAGAPVAAATVPHQGHVRGTRAQSFVREMERLCREDPGARSALRSGLRKDLDAVHRMHRLVATWLPAQRTSDDVQRAYYAVAAMIAAQPRSAPAARDDAADDPEGPDETPQAPGTTRRSGVSLGTAFAVAVTEGPGREKEMREGTAESRLNLLTRQSLNGLHRHLPASVGYLRSLGVDIDWVRLLDDLGTWRTRSGRISRTWLQDYYRLRGKATARLADAGDEEELVAEAAGAPHTP
ncbi:type I-E CRISPR-associated protein Cse2/CasB [uncultured Streptomyces sp.]|uniref:type I-E CRISPR-associated protein Cse2/CasB n=1 Tax=uncultured Streptomyces sp. TaxID=174707 RepID=UPI00260D1398|nr:type I-E CRISPR-associated protein Cse2/CasB [uncultured Streptomyces sp.]